MKFTIEEGVEKLQEATAKVRVGAVSYLNTNPLVYGLEQGLLSDAVELLFDYPGKVAEQLLDGSIDLGLVPVAILPKMKEYHIISDYCIAADGPVASVCLFSEVPLEEIETVLLDYQSRTSVQLVQYLFKEYWQRQPVFKPAGEQFIQDIKGTTAAVVIGDRAFHQRTVSKYVYDLGEAWKNHTGLPFVFAAWVSNKPLSAAFVKAFNESNALGFEHLDTVIAAHPESNFDLHAYYTKYIQYRLDDAKKAGLERFVSWCEQQLRTTTAQPA